MTEMFRSELMIALSEHRLIEQSGWMDDNGRIEYECRCGHLMHETPRYSKYQGGDTLLAEHQASILDELGFRRAPDQFDTFALEELCSTVSRRRTELSGLENNHAWSMSPSDRIRLISAQAEIEALESVLQAVFRARVTKSELPLQLPGSELAIA